MAKQSLTFQPRNYGFQAYSILPADTTTAKLIATGAADDTAIKALVITSTDTSDRKASIIINNGTADFVLDTVDVPAASGTDGSTVAVNALAGAYLPLDTAGKKYLWLKATHTLKVALSGTVTAAKQVNVLCLTQDF